MAKKRTRNEISYEVSSGNIFADFGYKNPKEANVKLDLALWIQAIIKSRKLTQAKAASLMKLDQPKVSKIMRGILAEFTIERLMHCLIGLGCDLEIKPTLGKVETPSIHVSKKSNILKL